MIGDLEKTIVDLKTPGLNNPETYVLAHNRFNNYMVLIFPDLKKAEIYKIPYRNSSHQEIEILMSFDYLNLFRPKKDENLLFKIEDRKYLHVREKLFSFETNDEIVEFSSEHGFSDVKFPFAHRKENIYFLLYRKYSALQEYENSTVKNEYQYLYIKDEELKGDNITNENEGVVEYGIDFMNCKFICNKNFN